MYRKQLLFLFLFASPVSFLFAQQTYVYDVDLTSVEDDKVKVRLTAPVINKSSVIYHFPKIIPGTYRISDFGKFIHDFRAIDKSGKDLRVKRLSDNSWQISNAEKLASIEYKVEDTWDTETKNEIYPMAGTNIEEGKNFVINPPGFFGYFEGMRLNKFELKFRKPANFYAATPLKATLSTANEESFELENVDHLYDSPIMFSVPDTSTVKLGNTEVLIAVYSPKKLVQSKFIAQLMTNLLNASTKYLGGRLPVDKYAFIFYFNGEQRPFTLPGALEHNYSSFYSLPEAPQQALAATIMDIAAHEFFLIVTPLTIHSAEVRHFNFSEPVMSKHLWLYEGSTEYASDHVQVKYGLNTIPQFLDKLSNKIRLSQKQYKDDLPFTELSRESAGKHSQQFGNVYEKGALISACLDIYLLHLSGGAYGLGNLKHDLSVRFGKRTAFPDDSLFNIITEMTYPEIRSFFAKYVESGERIPYDYFFGLAGIKYQPVAVRPDFTLGNITFGPTQDGRVIVTDNSKMNAFGKKLGYKKDDELISVNGQRISPAELNTVLTKVKSALKEGDVLQLKIVRANANAGKDTITLSAPAEKIEIKEEHKLEMMSEVSMAQATVRRTWLAANERGIPLTVNMNDVSEIDQLIKALYDVISGPAGKRNWERFRSLFTSNAVMGAAVSGPTGSRFASFTPEEYIKRNEPTFSAESFIEREVARKVNQFGNIAQVFTTYEFDLGNGKVKQRGINSMQLVREQGRWWIASIIWQDESASLPIPQEYLK